MSLTLHLFIHDGGAILSTLVAMKTATYPTSEALNLSANVFTSQINSWIPATFASPLAPSSAEAEWQAVISRTGIAKTERLGLGHPSIDAPKTAGSVGLRGLQQSLKRDQSARAREKVQEQSDGSYGHANGSGRKGGERDRDSDEEDSRARLGIKRKRTVLDLLGGNGKGKNKKKAVGSIVVVDSSMPKPAAIEASRTDTQRTASPATVAQTPPAESTTAVPPAKFAKPSDPPAPHSISDSVPAPAPAHAPAPISPSNANTAQPPSPSTHLPPSPKLSKNARKKARQRQRKLAENNHDGHDADE